LCSWQNSITQCSSEAENERYAMHICSSEDCCHGLYTSESSEKQNINTVTCCSSSVLKLHDACNFCTNPELKTTTAAQQSCKKSHYKSSNTSSEIFSLCFFTGSREDTARARSRCTRGIA
jgi:hypothetical protein